MDWIAQVRLTGFAAALFLCLLAQLPGVGFVRWWFYASGFSFIAAIVGWFTGGQPPAQVGSILILCLCAELGCVAAGLFWQSSRPRHARASFAAALLAGFLLLPLCSRSAAGLAAATSVITLVILLLLLAVLWRQRVHRPLPVSLVSALLLLGVMHELVDIAVIAHWADASFAPLLTAAGGFIGPGGITIALFFLAFTGLSLRDEQLQSTGAHLRQVVDATDHGICEIDRGGQITFVNQRAASMLGISADLAADAWIQEKLKAEEDEASVRALS